MLAAGHGTRMKSKTPKVLHPIGGKPMLVRVLETVSELSPISVFAVIAPDMEDSVKAIDAPNLHWIIQQNQLGTGHAAAQALPRLKSDSQVLMLNGDGPLVQADTLKECVSVAKENGICLVSAVVPDASGLGRIIREESGAVQKIVEHKDLLPKQTDILEVNSGILCVNSSFLHDNLAKLNSENQQNEYYLTDLIGLARQAGDAVSAVKVQDHREILGVNDRKQLAEVERIFQRRQADRLMEAGVSLADPSRIDIRGELRCGKDCLIDINAIFEGIVELGDNVVIGPNCCLRDVRIASDSQIKDHTVIESANIGERCTIGPFARIRPGTELAEDVHVGNFVEIKNSSLDSGVKTGHLAYVGDAEVGVDTNIGAGVITCNFDGKVKHQTEIGNGVFVGSNSSLVAPLVIADGAYVAAGSTITKDLLKGDFAIARGRQKTVEGGASRFKSN